MFKAFEAYENMHNIVVMQRSLSTHVFGYAEAAVQKSFLIAVITVIQGRRKRPKKEKG